MANTDSPLEAAAFRVERIKYGVATSIAGKVVTTAVQLLAMPIAIRALGPEQFALYAMLSAALTWVGLANIGIGPGLVLGIASARAARDQVRESRLATSASLPVLSIAALFGLGGGTFILFGPVTATFGENYSQYGATIRFGLMLLLGFTLLQTLSTVVEAAQAAYQEQYVFNLWMAFGGSLTLAALVLCARIRPTVISLILAVNLPPLICRLTNSARFLSKHSHLIPRLRSFDRSDSRNLVVSGMAYSLVSIGSFLNHQFPIILIGRTLASQSAANFTAVMNAFVLGFGLVTMVTGPLLPAIADSMARGEVVWARRAYVKLLSSTMVYACVVGVLFAVIGQWIFRVWLGQSISPSATLVALLGLYFILAIWEHVHDCVLMGLKQIKIPSVTYLIRSVLAVMLVSTFIRNWGESGAMIGLCISVIVTTGWSFPYWTRRAIEGAQERI